MSTNILTKGIILGGALAAAGLAAGLMATKNGKKITKDLEADLRAVAKRLQKYIGALRDMTEEEYQMMVKEVVAEYAAKKKLAAKSADTLVAILNDKWAELRQEYLASKPA